MRCQLDFLGFVAAAEGWKESFHFQSCCQDGACICCLWVWPPSWNAQPPRRNMLYPFHYSSPPSLQASSKPRGGNICPLSPHPTPSLHRQTEGGEGGWRRLNRCTPEDIRGRKSVCVFFIQMHKELLSWKRGKNASATERELQFIKSDPPLSLRMPLYT